MFSTVNYLSVSESKHLAKFFDTTKGMSPEQRADHLAADKVSHNVPMWHFAMAHCVTEV